MRFAPTDDQNAFVETLDALLAKSDTPGVIRAWAQGDHGPGLRLWRRLAELGVTGLLVPEEYDGLALSPVELVLAMEQLGRHAVPGPWVESLALVPALVWDGDVLRAVAGGEIASAAVDTMSPYALDGDVAAHLFWLDDAGLHPATAGDLHRSVDPARRLTEVTAGSPAEPPSSPAEPVEAHRALDLAALACAAQLVGLGEAMLDRTVDYARARRQFGREIGSYQALKHRLADVRIALDFARPLVWVAALSVDSPDRARDVSAAKVASAEAAWTSARAALQVHGAVGYTAELDLSLWLLKTRALVAAWGTTAYHRGRVLAALTTGAR